MTKRDLIIYQRGYARSFVHVSDIVKALVTGLDAPIPYSKVLEDEVIPSEERIKAGIREVLK